MIHVIIPRLIYTALALLALAVAVAYCQPAVAQHDHHPDWLQRTGCCGPRDCFELRVRFTPLGWQIVAMRLKPTDPWTPPPRSDNRPAGEGVSVQGRQVLGLLHA